MSSFFPTLMQVVPVFFLVGLGFLLRRTGFLSESAVRSLTRLVFYVLLPPLMFLGVAETRLSVSFDPALILWSLAAVGLFSTVIFLATARWLVPAQRGVLTQGASRSNLAFVGLAILLNLYGEPILGKAAVFIAFQAFMINLLMVLFLLLPHHSLRDFSSWKRIGASLALNPIVLGCALGVAFSASTWELSGTLTRILRDLAAPTLPLALLTVGGSLGGSSAPRRMGLVLLAAFLKLVLLPALVWLFLVRAGVPTPSLVMAVVLLGSPTAVTSFIMAREMGGDENLASAIVVATTALSPLTLAAWIGILS
ncbi:MAG: AEC family transporter [bacterium]